MFATVSSGHVDLSDWLLLIAFIVFVIAAIVTFVEASIPKINLIAIGLALVSLAWFVL